VVVFEPGETLPKFVPKFEGAVTDLRIKDEFKGFLALFEIDSVLYRART